MLRSLKPKTPTKQPAPLPTAGLVQRQRTSTRRTCRVPICPELHCNLNSHHQFGRISGNDSSAIERPIDAEAQVLGLENAVERDLFQHCVDNMSRRKLFTYSPAYPSVYSLSKIKEAIVRAALGSSHAALIIVSIAFCDVFLQRAAPDEDLDRLYNKVRLVVRSEADVDVILMGIVAQSVMDRHRGRDIHPHQKAIRELVRDRVHTLRESLHYVIEADRRIALWTNSLSDLHKGSAEMNELQYVQESRALIDVFEKEGRSLDSPNLTPLSPYCYYKRDRLANAFTTFHAVSTGQRWCMVVAARIMEFPLTFEGELESCMSMVTSSLIQGLKRRLQEVDWSDDKQMLVWMLFIVEDVWTVRRLLEDLHGSKLPTCEEQWHIIRTRFVWTERMKPHFERLFDAVMKCIIRSDSNS